MEPLLNQILYVDYCQGITFQAVVTSFRGTTYTDPFKGEEVESSNKLADTSPPSHLRSFIPYVFAREAVTSKLSSAVVDILLVLTESR